LDWAPRFKAAVEPLFEDLYQSVLSGEETRLTLEANSKKDYRVGLNAELNKIHESEMWQTGTAVRSLRPENWQQS
jgi:ketol-acid reductoisomerase